MAVPSGTGNSTRSARRQLLELCGDWEPLLVPLAPRAVLGRPQARRQGALLGERNQSTVWQAPSPKMIMSRSDEAKQDHPAQKPALLFEIPIRNHLRPGELVYDPFLGSGTTLVAAEMLGRRCLGLELDPRYAQLVIDRWQALTGEVAQVADG